MPTAALSGKRETPHLCAECACSAAAGMGIFAAMLWRNLYAWTLDTRCGRENGCRWPDGMGSRIGEECGGMGEQPHLAASAQRRYDCDAVGGRWLSIFRRISIAMPRKRIRSRRNDRLARS